jgi:hypothetical protein
MRSAGKTEGDFKCFIAIIAATLPAKDKQKEQNGG